VKHNLEQLALAGVIPDRIVVAGGGTQGGLWTQIVSDIVDIEQVVPSVTFGASFGAALVAAQAVDGDVSVDTWNPPVAAVTPNETLREFYDERYRRYRELYTQTADIVHYLAGEQRSQMPARP
jgi:xylulokinase